MALGSALPHTACQSDFAPAGEGERRSDLLIRQNYTPAGDRELSGKLSF